MIMEIAMLAIVQQRVPLMAESITFNVMRPRRVHTTSQHLASAHEASSRVLGSSNWIHMSFAHPNPTELLHIIEGEKGRTCEDGFITSLQAMF